MSQEILSKEQQAVVTELRSGSEIVGCAGCGVYLTGATVKSLPPHLYLSLIKDGVIEQYEHVIGENRLYPYRLTAAFAGKL